MSTSYSGEKIINRQRICTKCKGFVTHDKVAEDQFGCALCGHRIGSSPHLERKIPPSVIAAIVAQQWAEHAARQKEAREEE